jgi:hypothetical protein
MLHNTQNYGFLDFVNLPKFSVPENTSFQKLDLFSSLCEGRETPTPLGLLETADLNHWTTNVIQHIVYKHLTPG